MGRQKGTLYTCDRCGANKFYEDEEDPLCFYADGKPIRIVSRLMLFHIWKIDNEEKVFCEVCHNKMKFRDWAQKE